MENNRKLNCTNLDPTGKIPPELEDIKIPSTDIFQGRKTDCKVQWGRDHAYFVHYHIPSL